MDPATKEDFERASAVHTPTLDHVKRLAEGLGLDVTEEDVKQYTACLEGFLKVYDKVYEMEEPTLPVKYPRTTGRRPAAGDNPHNAWYVKTDIIGAPSGKLSGRTVAIKDSIAVAGVPMMNGSKLLEGYTPEYDATVVTSILDAGGHIVGKAQCVHLCFGGDGRNIDRGPVTNPRDLSRTSGGSSSGCAALLAVGEVDLAVGGDQGESVRIPSAWCGTVGLKPTWGLVPYTGAASMSAAVDHLGPMARNVKDCALLLEVIAGYDQGRDHRQPLGMIVPEYTKHLTPNLDGVKIGVVNEGFENCEPDVAAMVRAAAHRLSDGGATVSDISVPIHADGQSIWSPIALEGIYESMFCRAGAGPGVKGFQSTTMLNHLTRAYKTQINDLSHEMKALCLFGTYIRETNNYLYNGRASNLVMKLTEEYDRVLAQYDVLIMPTIPFKAPKMSTVGTQITDLVKQSLGMVQNLSPFNATGHPAISVNAGDSEGLPVGMQIIGRKWRDQDVLKVAFAYECLRDTQGQKGLVEKHY